MYSSVGWLTKVGVIFRGAVVLVFKVLVSCFVLKHNFAFFLHHKTAAITMRVKNTTQHGTTIQIIVELSKEPSEVEVIVGSELETVVAVVVVKFPISVVADVSGSIFFRLIHKTTLGPCVVLLFQASGCAGKSLG